jgi:protein O-mannosyl-transferase
MFNKAVLSLRDHLVLAAITFVIFSPLLRADFLNWDDHKHLYQNQAILNFDVPRMFRETVLDIYLPLTSLSFAVENKIFGLQPFVFHLDNILLHIILCCLLMGFFVRLGASARAAFLAALLFAIHPMHVESVAWVTERKDVLYGCLYVLALRQWLSWIDGRRIKDLGWTLVWASLSLLSKPMAISLPLVMLFMEWFRAGGIRRIRWDVYVPFFALAVGIGWLTYMHHVRNPIGDIGVSGLIWIWTFCFYIWKFFCPVVVHPMYVLPTPVSLFHPAFLGSIILFVSLVVILWRTARGHLDRWLLWAAGVFFLSIFFLLKFDAHDPHLVADRFMYLPSMGICLWLGIKGDLALTRYGQQAMTVIAGILVVLSACTFMYTFVWKDSISLWSHVIGNYPQKELGYNNRAVAYAELGQYELAIKDHTTALTFPSNKALAFYNRGLNYRDWSVARLRAGDRGEADRLYWLGFNDFDQAIQLDPHYAKTYALRGMARFYFKDLPGAITDLNAAIERAPDIAETYNNRGNVRAAMGDLDLALNDYRKSIELEASAEPYNNMGIIYARKGIPAMALESFKKALTINPHHAQAYFNRSVVLRGQGDLKGALADALKARSLGAVFDDDHLRSLQAPQGN